MTRFQVRSLGAGIPITVTEPRQMWVQEWSFQVYAKVICNNNVGWGEALPAALNSVQSYTTMIDGFANVVEKEDSENIRRVWEKMDMSPFQAVMVSRSVLCRQSTSPCGI